MVRSIPCAGVAMQTKGRPRQALQRNLNNVRPLIAPRTLAAAALAVALISHGAVAARDLTPEETAQANAVLAAAPDHGLPAPDLAKAPIEDAIVSYAAAQHGARVDPRATDADWAFKPEAFDADAGLHKALDTDGLAAWLAALPPDHSRYAALVEARRRYGRLAADGDWNAPTPPPGLKRGAAGRGVLALRRRLEAEGYAAVPDKAPTLFDAGLDQALRLFELHHDLRQDGVVTAPVLAALATPPKTLLAIIDANLERWRWAPRDLPDQRIEVNIAAARATLYQGVTPVTDMRAVVGDPAHRTTMFAAQATGVVINPPWYVPADIAAKELFPREKREPGYLARNDYVVVDGMIRQKAGPLSALGHVKIELDDPYEIYLHDTPERTLFALSDRALSHGCVRLQHPVDLAAALLAPQGRTADDLQTLIAAKTTRRIALKTHMPTYLFYWTAEANADGTVTFHPDRYGWDAKLNAALAAL
jgi:murein L,D-transpeptidase YcbB/YkuD